MNCLNKIPGGAKTYALLYQIRQAQYQQKQMEKNY